jgi:hypothetical protein
VAGRTMHSRCAFVGQSLSFRSCCCCLDSLFLWRTRKAHRHPPLSRSTGSARVQSISQNRGVSISATTCNGPIPASTTLRVRAVGRPFFPIGRGGRKTTTRMPALPGTGCTFAHHGSHPDATGECVTTPLLASTGQKRASIGTVDWECMPTPFESAQVSLKFFDLRSGLRYRFLSV